MLWCEKKHPPFWLLWSYDDCDFDVVDGPTMSCYVILQLFYFPICQKTFKPWKPIKLRKQLFFFFVEIYAHLCDNVLDHKCWVNLEMEFETVWQYFVLFVYLLESYEGNAITHTMFCCKSYMHDIPWKIASETVHAFTLFCPYRHTYDLVYWSLWHSVKCDLVILSLQPLFVWSLTYANFKLYIHYMNFDVKNVGFLTLTLVTLLSDMKGSPDLLWLISCESHIVYCNLILMTHLVHT